MIDKTCIEIANEFINTKKQNQIKAANELLDDANDVVPVITGNLKDSGHVEVERDSVKVVYDTDYAIYVHEDPRGRGYKWLENTMIDNMDKYLEIMEGEE